MPRRSRSSAPARSAPAPAHHAAPQRPATAVAHPPPAQVPAMPQQSQGPGLFGQMAATAGGVAVGSTVGHVIGHGITSMFGGGGSSEPAPQPQQYQQQPYQQPYAPQDAYGNNSAQLSAGGAACEADAKAFNTCMERNDFDVTKCQFYLDMLKDCRAFSKTL